MKRVYHLLIIGIGFAFLGLVLKAGVPCLSWACTPNFTTSDTSFVAGSADRMADDAEGEEGRAPRVPAVRVSAAGVHYGHCAGTVLAVVLFPEPCGWQERPISLASR